MKLFVHSLKETLYEGEALVVTLPADGGEVSVLDGHIPFVTSLSQGSLLIKKADSSVKKFKVVSGFAEINSNRVIVLVQ